MAEFKTKNNKIIHYHYQLPHKYFSTVKRSESYNDSYTIHYVMNDKRCHTLSLDFLTIYGLSHNNYHLVLKFGTCPNVSLRTIDN